MSLALVSDTLTGGGAIKLVHDLRKKFSESRLAIVAVHSEHAQDASEYLRNGANDFLRAPYSQEEFQCRIRTAIKLQQQMEALEKAASHDNLTGLLNRRAFFQTSQPVVAAAHRNETPIALVMMDIDHFKTINDTHGHDTGEERKNFV